MSAQEVKEQVLWAAQEMLRSNLVEGTAGNIGARLPDGNAVLTPSSLDYMEMTLDDLVVCDLDGNVLEGTRSPTTE
jgi:L-fuculose-phosphate aldolase